MIASPSTNYHKVGSYSLWRRYTFFLPCALVILANLGQLTAQQPQKQGKFVSTSPSPTATAIVASPVPPQFGNNVGNGQLSPCRIVEIAIEGAPQGFGGLLGLGHEFKAGDQIRVAVVYECDADVGQVDVRVAFVPPAGGQPEFIQTQPSPIFVLHRGQFPLRSPFFEAGGNGGCYMLAIAAPDGKMSARICAEPSRWLARKVSFGTPTRR